MKLVDLSVEDQELLLALIEIAREEGNANRDWDEIEPVLASCWKEAHLGASGLKWDDVVRYVRKACIKPA
mgnify:FL=1